MKSDEILKTIGVFFTGGFIVWVLSIQDKNPFNVGDCVRYLGSGNIYKVTVVNPGVIEVKDSDGYLYKRYLTDKHSYIKAPCE